MIVVKIFGGLGNQLFQYAYAKSLQTKGYKVKIDISSYQKKENEEYQLHQYKIDIPEASKWESLIAKYGFRIPLREKSLLFQKRFLKPKKTTYVIGKFQSENYFKNIRAVLLKQFILKKQLSSSTINYLKEITIRQHTCSIYLCKEEMKAKNETENSTALNLDFIKRAAKMLINKNKQVFFFIFSNDIAWAKKNFKIKNLIFVEHEVNPYENLHLMSLCNHNILTNNHYSWWAAWLNQHTNKLVVAPKKLSIDKENEIYCKEWILL